MSKIKLTNSLTRKKEDFIPIEPPNVGMYTCGPTVYDYAHIGNMRTYTTGDIILRTLIFNGYQVNYVMNLTDVGHLTGDNEGDADTGEDRMEKAVRRENETAWEIAKKYSKAFIQDMKKLNFRAPNELPKATEHIDEQIKLAQKLEEKGLTYKTSDGIYFDTKQYEKVTGNKYGELSTLDEVKEGARVQKNAEKRNPTDFALWKFSVKPEERHMEWESPWGLGFPGWHIECSAMSMKYLGESFDIHVGGEDLRPTHHPNEIAQSEAATGKQFVKYWIHTTHLQVDGKRMGKSLGNAYTIKDIESKGFDALSLRYLYLTSHYKDTLNFTWKALESANTALNNLRSQVAFFRSQNTRTVLSEEKRKKTDDFSKRFTEAINDDFNTPKALAVLWESVKSNIPSEDKYDLTITFDEVLGLGLKNLAPVKITKVDLVDSGNKAAFYFDPDDEIVDLVDQREVARKAGDYEKADRFRDEIIKKGYTILDKENGPTIT